MKKVQRVAFIFVAFLCFQQSLFAQERIQLLRISIIGIDTFKIDNQKLFREIDGQLSDGEGDLIFSAEYGRGLWPRKVFVFNAGGHGAMGDSLGAGFQLEFGPSFFSVGPGVMIIRKQFHTYTPGKSNSAQRTDSELMLAPYFDITLHLGKDHGFYLKYKNSPATLAQKGYAQNYQFLALGLFLKF